MKKILIIAGVVAVLAAMVFASLAGKSENGKAIEVGKAERRDLSSRVKATGEVTPERKVDVSAKIVGEIIGLPVKEGDAVHSGQVLVQIERDLYVSARDRVQAGLRQIEVSQQRLTIQLDDAERTLNRVRELQAQGFARQDELDAAEVAVATARVEIEAQVYAIQQQRSALRSTEEDLARTTIRAPMDGMVISLNAEKGETVVPGSTNLPGSMILTIADMSHLLAEVEVGEVDVPRIKLDQAAEIRVDALGDKILKGRVVEISSSGASTSGQDVIRFAVKIALDEIDPALRPSMTAKVDILTDSAAQVVSVPIQAVVKRRVDDQGNELKSDKSSGVEPTDVVYLFSEGKARLRKVQTGISDALHVEIKEGLQPDEEIVIGPYRTLKNLKHDEVIRRGEKKAKSKKSEKEEEEEEEEPEEAGKEEA